MSAPQIQVWPLLGWFYIMFSAGLGGICFLKQWGKRRKQEIIRQKALDARRL
uniref:DUF4752 family protein n=1 Tax=Salmonella sp. TaxID=599 RepID=UPI002981D2B6|nr:DUF4752 family protein [Salmonella sp.]